MSASSAVSTAVSNGFERVTIDGEEYLAQDVVAQREGVYYYPDPSGGVQRELVEAEELQDAIEETDEEPVLLKHPDAPDGTPKLTSNPRANYTEVGKWDQLDSTDDGKGIGGRVLIRVNEIGNHDGLLRRYIKKAAERYGEVSTGYGLTGVDETSGRYNGKTYDAKQRGLGLDHLALLPDEQGDCSVEDGCGLGRANGQEGELARTNNHTPTETEQLLDEDVEEVPKGTDPLKWLGERAASVLGMDQFLEAEQSEDNQNMQDQDKINELVEEYNFTRENIDHLEGTQCLDRIHEAVTNEDPSTMGNNNDNDEPFTEEQLESISDVVDERVNKATPDPEEVAEEVEVPDIEVEADDLDEEEIVDRAAEKAAAQAQSARAHEENAQILAQSEEFPHIDQERAERMNEDLAEEMVEELEESDEEGGEDRANYSGRPTGSSFDPSEHSGNEGGDMPVAGRMNTDQEE